MAVVLRRTGNPGGLVAARIGVHVIRHEWRVVTDGPAQERLVGRNQESDGGLQRSTGGDDPEEPPLLDHQGDRAAVGLEQLGRRLRHLLHQTVQIGTGQQRSGQMAEPLQLPVPPVGLLQRPPERVLLSLRQLPHVAEGHQGQEGGHRGQQEAHARRSGGTARARARR